MNDIERWMKVSENLGTMKYHTKKLAELLEALYSRADQASMTGFDRADIEVALKLARKDLELVK